MFENLLMKTSPLRKHIFKTSIINTIRFNFKYFKFKDAIHFPIWVSRHTNVIKLSGKITMEGPKHSGIIKVGYIWLGTTDTRLERTKWQLEGELIVKGSVSIGRGSSISVTGTLTLGDRFLITGSSTLICRKQIVFGNNVLISWDCLFMDTDFHNVFNAEGIVINEDRPIIVGDNVWFGCRNLILKGSEIPNGSVIAASSIISRQLSQRNCIYGGTHGGDVLKQDISWQV